MPTCHRLVRHLGIASEESHLAWLHPWSPHRRDVARPARWQTSTWAPGRHPPLILNRRDIEQ
jgi:hypothetical protein